MIVQASQIVATGVLLSIGWTLGKALAQPIANRVEENMDQLCCVTIDIGAAAVRDQLNNLWGKRSKAQLRLNDLAESEVS